MNAVEELETQAVSWPERAKALTVSDPATYEAASGLLRGIKALRDKIEATFKPMSEAAHTAWKEILAQRKKVETPLIDAEGALKLSMATYLEAEERARRKREAELAAIARKAEEDARVAEAAAYEQAGEHETAAAIIEAPPVAPAITLPKPKAEGIATRKVWKFRITDAKLIPRDYMTPDEQRIGGVVRALGSSTNIPGVQVYAETVVAVRR
jgi:hypothetical protein